jgi:hypothetical protein
MAQDTITRTGVRAPGVKRFRPLERWCLSAPRPPTLNGDTTLQAARCNRGDHGNGGIIRSPIRAMVLPDISHTYKDVCGLAQAKGLPSLIYHEPVLEVRLMRGAAGTTRILTIRVRSQAKEMWRHNPTTGAVRRWITRQYYIDKLDT